MTRIALAALALLACSKSDDGSRENEPAPTAPRPQAETAAASRPALVFLGDSITAGYGLPASQTMPTLIQERIDEAELGFEVINAGRSGDTSKSGLERLDWYLRPEVGLEVLVVNLGSNDAMRGLPLEELEGNLRTIIEKTVDARPEARVFLVQMETFPNMGARYTDAYRDVFPRVARSTDAELLPFPLEGIAGVPELNQADGIHPNAEGTERFATKMWEALRPRLVADSEPSDPAATPAGDGG